LREGRARVCAGSETTGYSIAWTLYLLAKHPAAAAALEAELDAAGLLATPARPHPRPFAFADISRLRYLDAVLKARALILGLHLMTRPPRARVW
jgi:cytochrome P450